MHPQRRPGGFHRLWASSASANLADGLLLAGLPVLATAVTTAPEKVAGVQVAFMLSMGLAALPSGVAADRYARGRVLVVANLVRALGLLAIVLAGWHGWQLAAVYAAALLAGSTEVLADVTAETSVQALVSHAGLARAHSRIVGTQVVLNHAVGAPIGGLLATVGLAPLVAVPATLYGFAAAVVSRLKVPTRPVSPGTTVAGSVTSEIAAGARALRRDPALRRLAISNALMNMGNTAFFAVAVLLVLGPLGLPRSAYGLFLAAVAVGGLLGTAGAHGVLGRVGSLTTMVAARLAAAVAYAVLSVTSSGVVASGAALALGASGTLWNVASRTVRQRLVSDEMLGRVTSTMMVVGIVLAPLGGVLGGVVAEVAGVRNAGGIAAGTTLLSLVAIRGMPPSRTDGWG